MKTITLIFTLYVSQVFAQQVGSIHKETIELIDGFTAKKNDKWGIISSNGDVVQPFEFDKIEWGVLNSFLKAYKDSSIFLFNFYGESLLDYPIKEIVEVNSTHFTIVYMNGLSEEWRFLSDCHDIVRSVPNQNPFVGNTFDKFIPKRQLPSLNIEYSRIVDRVFELKFTSGLSIQFSEVDYIYRDGLYLYLHNLNQECIFIDLLSQTYFTQKGMFYFKKTSFSKKKHIIFRGDKINFVTDENGSKLYETANSISQIEGFGFVENISENECLLTDYCFNTKIKCKKYPKITPNYLITEEEDSVKVYLNSNGRKIYSVKAQRMETVERSLMGNPFLHLVENRLNDSTGKRQFFGTILDTNGRIVKQGEHLMMQLCDDNTNTICVHYNNGVNKSLVWDKKNKKLQTFGNGAVFMNDQVILSKEGNDWKVFSSDGTRIDKLKIDYQNKYSIGGNTIYRLVLNGKPMFTDNNLKQLNIPVNATLKPLAEMNGTSVFEMKIDDEVALIDHKGNVLLKGYSSFFYLAENKIIIAVDVSGIPNYFSSEFKKML